MFGFRIVGPTTGRRILVDATKALAAYVSCAPEAQLDQEAYLSAFTFGEEFRQHLLTTGSTKGYAGSCGANFLHWDVDREDDLEAALDATRILAKAIKQRYGAPLAYYSGSKGFHLDLPTTWSPEPSPIFNRVARAFALNLAGTIEIDRGVYDKVRPFRAPNSRHSKTGLYKVRLMFDELMGMELEAILRLATKPRPFELPQPDRVAVTAQLDWQAAIETVERDIAAQAARPDEPRLNSLTLSFIRDGASKGDRHRLLFSAAANLAEFDCPAPLAHALLTEAALDTGLSPSDVRRQIECGLAYRSN